MLPSSLNLHLNLAGEPTYAPQIVKASSPTSYTPSRATPEGARPLVAEEVRPQVSDVLDALDLPAGVVDVKELDEEEASFHLLEGEPSAYLSIRAGLTTLQVPRAYHYVHYVQALEVGVRLGWLILVMSVVGVVVRHNDVFTGLRYAAATAAAYLVDLVTQTGNRLRPPVYLTFPYVTSKSCSQFEPSLDFSISPSGP